MFLHEMIFWVPNCSFHEMIISDNTERGSFKLTHCSYRKKHMKRKICQQRNAEIQSKTYISAEVFCLTCDQTFFVFFLCGGLDLITIQSNHLLGNPRYTFTECLLANSTDLRSCRNGFESVYFKH